MPNTVEQQQIKVDRLEQERIACGNDFDFSIKESYSREKRQELIEKSRQAGEKWLEEMNKLIKMRSDRRRAYLENFKRDRGLL